MRSMAIATVFAVAASASAASPEAGPADPNSCRSAAQREEQLRRIAVTSATVMVEASMEARDRINEASAAHSRALAGLRLFESSTEGSSGERCATERALAEEQARALADITAERKRHMDDAKRKIPAAIKGILAEYPDCAAVR